MRRRGRPGDGGPAVLRGAALALLLSVGTWGAATATGEAGPSGAAAGAPAGGASGAGATPPAAPHLEGPPPGHTGGFGEPSCRACHMEFDPNVGGSVGLEGLPATYEPGATYVVSVVLRSTEMEKAGFQAAARFAGGDGRQRGRPAGSLETVDARTAVVPDSTGAVPYVQHVAGSTDVDDPELATWTFRWTAPRDGGIVAFHVAANSANGDNSPLGDLVYTTELRLEAGPAIPPGSALPRRRSGAPGDVPEAASRRHR